MTVSKFYCTQNAYNLNFAVKVYSTATPFNFPSSWSLLAKCWQKLTFRRYIHSKFHRLGAIYTHDMISFCVWVSQLCSRSLHPAWPPRTTLHRFNLCGNEKSVPKSDKKKLRKIENEIKFIPNKLSFNWMKWHGSAAAATIFISVYSCTTLLSRCKVCIVCAEADQCSGGCFIIL